LVSEDLDLLGRDPPRLPPAKEALDGDAKRADTAPRARLDAARWTDVLTQSQDQATPSVEVSVSQFA
jgi:hypothetical protein